MRELKNQIVSSNKELKRFRVLLRDYLPNESKLK